MALKKEEILNIISQEPHKQEIQKSISNYFEDLSEPVAVSIGINKYWGRDSSPEHTEELTNILRSAGIDAVSYFDKEALNTNKFIVDGTGVSSPFLSPEDALAATILIEKTAINAGYKLVGHANPQTSDAMLYSSNNRTVGGNEGYDKKIDIKAGHPDIKKFEETEKMVGGNFQEFIDRKVKEAYDQSELLDIQKISEENVYMKEGEFLYRGGALGENPYAAISEFNARKVAHASPALAICCRFSGKGQVASTKGGAEYKPTKDNIEYGFIYKYKSMGEEQLYYGNVGLETARDPKTVQDIKQSNNVEKLSELNTFYDIWNDHQGEVYETPILPHHNKLEAIYLHIGHSGENKLFEIPINENGQVIDKEWKNFLYLHEPSDDKVKGYLAERRDAQKNEQKTNPKNTHKFELKEGLQEKNYKDLSNVGTLSFLQSIAYKGGLSVDNDGLISCNDDLDIHKTGIEKIPNLSNVRIKGACLLGRLDMSLLKMPEVEGPIFYAGKKFKDADKITTEKITKIFNGKTDNEGFINLKNSFAFEFDAVPLNIKNYKFQKLDITIPFQNVLDIPETANGCSRAQIMNQSEIPDMPAEKFIYKIFGNRGMSNVPPLYEGSFNSKAPIKEKDLSLNMCETNIYCLPNDLAKYEIKEIMFNKDVEIKSLDTIPYTTKGIYDLNFKGDLSNETFESFLSKTKGTDWVKENTSKNADGHLIINGDLDFLSNRYGDKQAPMTIKAFPKDFADVEIKGKVSPNEIAFSLNKHKEIAAKKNNESLSISASSSYINANFSEFKAKEASIEGNAEKMYNLKLPQNVKTLNIYKADFSNVELPEISKDCKSVGINDCKFGKDLDFSNIENSNFSIKNMDFSEKGIVLPKECEYLSISNTACNKLTMPEKTDRIYLENVSFNENFNLDLSSCKNINISNCDLSKVNLILPKIAENINIGENVKFSPDFVLDMSGIEYGGIDYSAMSSCKQVKLPKKILSDDPNSVFRVTENVDEVKLSFIKNNWNRISIPDNVKIVEDEKVSNKLLKAKGVTKEQIKSLKKERNSQKWNKFKSMLGFNKNDKDAEGKADSNKKTLTKEMKQIFKKTGRKDFLSNEPNNKEVKTTNLTKENINNIIGNNKVR